MDGEITVEVAIKLGVEAQKRGMVQEAEAFYHKVLEAEPDNADAYHLLGMLAYDIGQLDTAKDLILHAIDLNDKVPVFFNNLGNIYTDLELLNVARECFETAVKLRDDYPEAHFNLANTLNRLGDTHAAERQYIYTLEMDELFPQAYNNLGNLYKDSESFDKAIECYEKALAIAPNMETASQNLADAYTQKGFVLQEQQEYKEAIYFYQQALEINPEQEHVQSSISECYHLLGEDREAQSRYLNALSENPAQPEVHYNLALIYKDSENYAQAISHFQQAIALNPDFTDAHYNLANTLKASGDYQQAMQAYADALEKDANFYPAYVNLAVCLNGLGMFDEALKAIDKAEQLNQEDFEIYNNKGLILHNLRKVDEAIDCYRQALEISPDNKYIQWNMSLSLLANGQFDEGWKLYETRWDLQEQLFNVKNDFTFPQWKGEDLQSKRILVTAEQGLGDSIQFARLCKSLKQLGAHVSLKIQPPLCTLANTIEGIDEVMTHIPELMNFDYHCPLLSLPVGLKLSKENIPSDTPYIKTDENKVSQWKQRLAADENVKVGIVWAGNPRKHDKENNLLDARRSLQLKQLAPLSMMQKITLYSLQKGEPSIQLLTEKCGRDIKDYTYEFNDFADTAAFVENLDLVISVDTSVAHLAGAMNKKVWLLSRFDACWRWGIAEEASTWYPSMRIFNQPAPGAWNMVVNDVVNALQEELFV